MGQRGYWRVSDGSPVPATEAHALWAVEAYRVLVGVAGTYRAVITYKELAHEVMQASGLGTSVPYRYWIGGVLGRVVRESHRRGDPPLTALVVHTDDGKVGEGYKEVLEVAGEPPVEDLIEREHHAARSRLACYQRFGATLPATGGMPALAPKLEATIARQRSRESVVQPRVCPTCFIQLPSTGTCDSCGASI